MPFPLRVNSSWLRRLPVLTKCINFCFLSALSWQRCFGQSRFHSEILGWTFACSEYMDTVHRWMVMHMCCPGQLAVMLCNVQLLLHSYIHEGFHFLERELLPSTDVVFSHNSCTEIRVIYKVKKLSEDNISSKSHFLIIIIMRVDQNRSKWLLLFSVILNY